MENKHVLATILVLAIIIVGMFVFAYLKKNELQQPEQTQATQSENEPYANITRIDAKHFFTDPKHTLVGQILMPTPCDLLEWSTRVQESAPETVIVDFKVVNHTDTCAQVVTPQRFMVQFDAQKEAVIKATFEGRYVDLNLIPAQPGDVIDDSEVFIKG